MRPTLIKMLLLSTRAWWCGCNGDAAMVVVTRSKRRRQLRDQHGHLVCRALFDNMMETLAHTAVPAERVRALRTVNALLVAVKGIVEDASLEGGVYRTLMGLHALTRRVALGRPLPAIHPSECKRDVEHCDAFHKRTGVKLGVGLGQTRLWVYGRALFGDGYKHIARARAAIIGSLYSEVELEIELTVRTYPVSSMNFQAQLAALKELVARNVRIRVVVINRRWKGRPTLYAGPLNKHDDPCGRGASWSEIEGVFAWRRLMDHCPNAEDLVASVQTQRNPDARRVTFSFGTMWRSGELCNTATPVGVPAADRVTYVCDRASVITSV